MSDMTNPARYWRNILLKEFRRYTPADETQWHSYAQQEYVRQRKQLTQLEAAPQHNTEIQGTRLAVYLLALVLLTYGNPVLWTTFCVIFQEIGIQLATWRGASMPCSPWQRRVTAGSAREPSVVGKAINRAVETTRGGGQPLSASTRAQMEQHLGRDLSQVRIHDDAHAHHLAQSLDANALTMGSDIYFNAGRYHQAGERLLAHGLTHMVQQGGARGDHVQFDLMMSLPTALGAFEIDMATRTTPRLGLEGTISFLPDPSGPYAAEIGLIQVVNTTDQRTATADSPLDWTPFGEGGHMDLMTTGRGLADQGWFVDSQTTAHAQGTSIGPNYIEQWGIGGSNQFGWLRSPTDIRAASLYDFPSSPFALDFDFETVAKATDTQNIYGALQWGFQVRSGAVTNEYAKATSAQSIEFEEALERFRGYYAHEPVVLYFDTDVDTPMASETWKLTDVVRYMSEYPDTQIIVEGFADERGRIGYNRDLSQRRAESVANLAIAAGVDVSCITSVIGRGETARFSPGGGPAQGSWRANRRVVISFQRTANTPNNVL
jgi:outer membrane protein OmpA-like peptidoglycan-associated protein